MKVVFWGGPLNGEVRDIPPGLLDRGVIVTTPACPDIRPDDYLRPTPSWEVTYEQFRYRRVDVFHKWVARPLDAGRSWPVMVPAGASDLQLQFLLDWTSRPIVKGPRQPLEEWKP